ncbi:MAG TPA: molybdenum cofactor guanylyltransferase [Dissulfurispiraceae bacterium]|nr:molybdenum cofactor guanylyltransferase [Dissulfurispiraceae bacterium]
MTAEVRTAAILAGGENRRFPSLKAFIEIDGSSLINRNLALLRSLFDEVLISTNLPAAYFALGAPLIGDIFPSAGPISGIHACLLNAAHESIFVLACDMPFVRRELITLVCERHAAMTHDTTLQATVPVFDNVPQPLLGAYRRNAVPQMEDGILHGRTSMKRFLREINTSFIPEALVRQADPSGSSFTNINTLADYDRITTDSRRGSCIVEPPGRRR